MTASSVDPLEGIAWPATGDPETDHANRTEDGDLILDWIIIGGESGSNARPFHFEWMADLVAQCRDAGVAVFCKQAGSNGSNASYRGKRWKTRDKKGGDPAEWPPGTWPREWPEERR